MNSCDEVSIEVDGFNSSFSSCSPSYEDFGVKLIVDPMHAVTSDFLAKLLASSPGSLSLSIANDALEDLAAVPNQILAISGIVEGGPGMRYMSSVE